MRTQALLQEETKNSWNIATKRHNAQKRDQAAFLRDGGTTLFPEELDLLGDITTKILLHLCCNSGQDTLSLAQRGAHCTGVDFSEEAIAFARTLSRESGIAADFQQEEVIRYIETVDKTFDVVFASYGCLPWIQDISRLLRGIARILRPQGRFVMVEFHPMAWSFDAAFQLKDPYFAPNVDFAEPVSDYVGAAEGALSPSGHIGLTDPFHNPYTAHSYQHTTADFIQACLSASLNIKNLQEWPYANGCKIHQGLVAKETEGLGARRFTTPPHIPSLPLMLGLVAEKPHTL